MSKHGLASKLKELLATCTISVSSEKPVRPCRYREHDHVTQLDFNVTRAAHGHRRVGGSGSSSSRRRSSGGSRRGGGRGGGGGGVVVVVVSSISNY